MSIKTFSGIALLCALLFASSACRHTTKKYDEGSVIMYSDEGFKNFMQQECEVFEYQYPKAFIVTKYTNEIDVINGLLNDSCTLGVTSRKLTDAQVNHIKNKNKKIVRQEPIAVDAVALIVNKDNPVGLLSVSEIKDLFSGKISTWKQLGVNDTTEIKIVFDQKGSANVSYIEDNFLPKGAGFRSNVYAQHGNASVIDVVENDKSAIGFISVSWLGDNLERVQNDFSKDNLDSSKIKELEKETDEIVIGFTDKVKLLKVRSDNELDGYLPSQANIYGDPYTNKPLYPLMRTVYLVSTASPQTVGHSFFSFVTGFIGQKILLMTGILPYHVHPRVVEL